jgi:guanylate kinase
MCPQLFTKIKIIKKLITNSATIHILPPSINAFKNRLDKHWQSLPSLYDQMINRSLLSHMEKL